MNKTVWCAMIVMGLACACQKNEQELSQTLDAEYFAVMEKPSTKTSMDDNNNVLWNSNDYLTIFRQTSLGTKYKIMDAYVGKNYGGFSKVEVTETDDFYAGVSLEHNIAYYPYTDDLTCLKTGSDESQEGYRITGIVLPVTQKYCENSFGEDAFPMVAVSENHELTFKNICGGIKLKLKGTQVVSSIRIEGKNNEKLSGLAEVTAYVGGSAPVINMDADASNYVILDCGDGVRLKEYVETEFIIALPPVVFSKGFTVTVTDAEGGKCILDTDKSNTVLRSSLLSMPVNETGGSTPVSNPILIKELYSGGCPKDDGSGSFTQDRYVILYNNSAEKVNASNICFGFIGTNSNGAAVLGSLIDADGNLVYEKEGMIPAMLGVWRFNTTVEIEPYSQIVVAITGAIDHTATYSLSVNLANSAYYAMYDPESGYNLANMYPAPDTSVPTTNYLKATKYGAGTGWTLSTTSPAFFIFNKAGIHDYASIPDNRDTRGSFEGARIPFEWIVDGVEVFVRGADDKNTKRLTANVDAGNVQHTSKLGYSLYRNVDKAATEAIEGNKDKLVYGYAGGTKDIDVEGGTTDPSGIDAEKSIKNGAKIVYMDTNNSTNDFHERAFASLTGK